jgi:hypothetical protein
LTGPAKDGDARGATADLDRDLMLDPQLSEAWNNRGLIRYGAGNASRLTRRFIINLVRLSNSESAL